MNKTIIVCISIIALCAIICLVIYLNGTRYVTIVAGDGNVYKVDRRTGKSVLLVGAEEIIVGSSKDQQKRSDEEMAIDMAKQSATLNKYFANEAIIKREMANALGELEFIGWQVKGINRGKYLVSYSFLPDSSWLARDLIRRTYWDEKMRVPIRDISDAHERGDAEDTLLRYIYPESKDNMLGLYLRELKYHKETEVKIRPISYPNSRVQVWAFEVNIDESIVRNINGDNALESQYGFER